MKRFFLIFLFFIINFSYLPSQDKKDVANFGINFNGFVKTDIFWDSRQNFSLREGHFLLYPEPTSLDKQGKDVNARANFNILSIQTRLTGTIKAPDAFGAKTSGLIEGEFFGTSDADLNGFRIRHAFAKLNWEKSELLIGQTWHPMFIAESFPGVISFNTGAPFQPFSRNPQLRFTYKFKQYQVIAAMLSQRDFTDMGPSASGTPVNSSIFLRNSGTPIAHLQFRYKPSSSENIFGFGGGFKSLLPELKTTKNYKTDKSINSFSAFAFGKLKNDAITFKMYGTYVQNATDLTMIGGYAVKSIIDTSTGIKEYTNINTGSIWGEIHTNGKNVVLGLFAGYTKNLGSNDNITGRYYSRGNDIDYIYRISPRVIYIAGKMQFATELEFTSAAYGNIDSKGKVYNAKEVNNLRILFAAILNF